MTSGKYFWSLRDDGNAIVNGGSLAHLNFALEDTEAPRPWQVRGSDVWLFDEGTPGTSPQWAPQVAEGRATEG